YSGRLGRHLGASRRWTNGSRADRHCPLSPVLCPNVRPAERRSVPRTSTCESRPETLRRVRHRRFILAAPPGTHELGTSIPSARIFLEASAFRAFVPRFDFRVHRRQVHRRSAKRFSMGNVAAYGAVVTHEPIAVVVGLARSVAATERSPVPSMQFV